MQGTEASYLDAPDISRSRSDHSHQRRAAAVEFPDVAGGLQRTRVPTVHWPDFDKAALEGASAEMQTERRFGGLAAETGS